MTKNQQGSRMERLSKMSTDQLRKIASSGSLLAAAAKFELQKRKEVVEKK